MEVFIDSPWSDNANDNREKVYYIISVQCFSYVEKYKINKEKRRDQEEWFTPYARIEKYEDPQRQKNREISFFFYNDLIRNIESKRKQKIRRNKVKIGIDTMDKYDRETHPHIRTNTRDKTIIFSCKYPKEEEGNIEVDEWWDDIGIPERKLIVRKEEVEISQWSKNTSFVLSSEIFGIWSVKYDWFIFEKDFRFEIPSCHCIFSEGWV